MGQSLLIVTMNFISNRVSILAKSSCYLRCFVEFIDENVYI